MGIMVLRDGERNLSPKLTQHVGIDLMQETSFI